MKIIVVGCGRVGIELALSLQHDQQVTVIDRNAKAFDQLGADFAGRTVQGDGLDQSVLKRAGIETADALACVTSSDNVNAVVGRVAQNIFHVERVIARLYNPRRAQIYEKLDLKTISPSSWGAHQIQQHLIDPHGSAKN
jgi:trk system potassium uptake protein TrkA